MKYKVGDKVRIINKRGIGWNCCGEMDEYFGKVVTITSMQDNGNFHVDSKCWLFSKKDIDENPRIETKIFNAGNKTVVILADGRRGEAKCSPDDEYNPVVGVAIAYGRALAK